MGTEVFGDDVGKEAVTESCGCVFCDLDLYTKEHEGGQYHQITARDNRGYRVTKFILCPVKSAQKKANG